MNVHHPHDDDRSPSDPLDGLLAQAHWEEPAPERVTRLRQVLGHAVGQEATFRRRRPWAMIGLAAAALVAVTFGLWSREGQHKAIPTASEPRGLPPRASTAPNIPHRPSVSDSRPLVPAHSPDVDSDPDRERSDDSPGDLRPSPAPTVVVDQAPTDRPAAESNGVPARAPNTFERFVVASIERRLPAATTSGGNQPPAPREPDATVDPSPVDEAIARLAAGGEQGIPEEDYAALIESLIADREASQRALIARLADPATRDRPAATRLLAEIATPAALDTLRSAFAAGETRPAAAVGLARLENATHLVAMIESERDASTRATLLSGLVERDDALAVAALLDMIADPARAESTLAALGAARRPPIDRWFAVLTGPQVDRRALAGRALGRIDGPIVTRRLVELVSQGAYQHDALMALVGSRGVEAERFVALARNDVTLTASVHWAERQFAILFPQQQKRLIP